MDGSARVELIRHLIQVGHRLDLETEPSLEEIANTSPDKLSPSQLLKLADIAQASAGILRREAQKSA